MTPESGYQDVEVIVQTKYVFAAEDENDARDHVINLLCGEDEFAGILHMDIKIGDDIHEMHIADSVSMERKS